MSYADSMQAVAELARVAGDHALQFYGKRIDIEGKADGSPVTIADRSTEALAREWIESRFPDDGILGEESGIVRDDAWRRWVIDPVDATKSFVRGVPLWGTLVALVEHDVAIAGAAYFPALGEIVCAAAGEGCWWNDSKCAVSAIAELADATVLTTDARFSEDGRRRAGWQALSRSAGLSRTWGDCYGYLLVATGRAEVMVDPIVSEWDVAAFVPIIAEAGGQMSGWGPIETRCEGSAIATNLALAIDARECLLGRIKGEV